MTDRISWTDLPKPESYFTKRNALMLSLDDGKIIQYYSANTKLQVVQKTTVHGVTYYRTASARENSLNWAFKASAFGLPDEVAPLVPTSFSHRVKNTKAHSHTSYKKQTSTKKKAASAKSGEQEKPVDVRRSLRNKLSSFFRKRK